METDNSTIQQSNDEPKTKRPKIESEGSTSSKPERKEPFLSLPSDVLAKVIGYTSIAQWPSLELLDEKFQSTTWIVWRQLRNVNVDRDFMIKPETDNNRPSLEKSVNSLFQKLVERSPFLTRLSGFDVQFDDTALNSHVVRSLAQFEHLESISLGDEKFFTDRRGIQLENVVEFLESTRSRTCLKELQLYDVYVNHQGDWATVLDRFDSSFVNGQEIQLSLKLEKFSFSSHDSSLRIRLDALDTTRLTELRLGHASIHPDQLTNVIERASNLQRVELSFLRCSHRECNGPRQQANKNLLMALASHENLTAVRLGMFGYNCNCKDFEAEFVDMLKTIGRRGQLRKLALDGFCEPASVIDMDVICTTICEYIPYLQWIRLYDDDITDESACNIFSSLRELREIWFMNLGCGGVTANAVEKISQLPHLKRLALKFSDMDDKNSMQCLDNASTLMELRIRFAHSIIASVYEKWSNGFASNLQTLMLSGVAEKDNHDEEGLVHLLEKAVQLRALIISGRITNRSLMAIAQSCPELEILGVQSTSNEITAQCLQEIVDRCPKLKKLGGFGDEMQNRLQFPKYRKMGDVDMKFWEHDFDDNEYE